jgi:choline dehydrogenase-like flavoprotein
MGPIPFAGAFFSIVKPLVRAHLERVLAEGPILASIVEDLPYRGNRVELDRATGQITLHYRVQATERKRIEQMRQHLRRLFKPFHPMLIRQAENNERLAHVCGTCRFGEDPANSVLDRDNRAHGVENLYVADASFFPTSAGINPGLTIAANALRAADNILKTW